MLSQNLNELLHRNPHVRAALQQLLEARRGAESLALDVWTVAVELSNLLNTGCTVTDLRLLVAAGYVDHAEEITQRSDQVRSFRPEPRMMFGTRSCFLVTTAGAAWVAQLEDDSDSGPVKWNGTAGRRVPRWSATARELRVDGQVLKRFRRPAPTLELVLAAFEEEGWPRHLDDPLSPEHEIVPQERLRDTVRRLNGCQAPHRIHFESDGLGAGIRWTWADREAGKPTDEPRMSDGVGQRNPGKFS